MRGSSRPRQAAADAAALHPLSTRHAIAAWQHARAGQRASGWLAGALGRLPRLPLAVGATFPGKQEYRVPARYIRWLCAAGPLCVHAALCRLQFSFALLSTLCTFITPLGATQRERRRAVHSMHSAPITRVQRGGGHIQHRGAHYHLGVGELLFVAG